MEGDMVVADAAALAQGIDRDGRVSVYGIFFDTDKSEIKPESKAALDEIAKFLRSRATLRVFVVGHTDMTATMQHNQTLSEARVRAVVNALVTSYGIAATRLEAHGVGPLSPVAANTTEAGRSKNRRVELVAR
jgi:outer membrane protein OmpA-like peptidoglycan-associated protein